MEVDPDGDNPLRINDQGRVIGSGSDDYGRDLGFVWDRGLGLCDLGWVRAPTSINAQGLVGGEHRSPVADELSEAFLWEPATGVRSMGQPTDRDGFHLVAVNDAGQFAGTATNGESDDYLPSEAYAWDPSTGWTGLGRESEVADLNDAGQILVSTSGSDPEHILVWTPGSPPRDIGTGHSGDLNNAGQVVWGSYPNPGNDEQQTHLWDPATDTRTEIPISQPSGLNDEGQVVGERDIASEQTHAVVWSAAEGLTDLGTLPGDTWSSARGINQLGHVIGLSGTGASDGEVEDGRFHAFVWDPDAGMRDLGVLSPSESSEAVAINDAGQVVGWSGFGDGRTAASVVIWDPVPGP